MNKIEYCDCGNKLTFYENYNFDVFPIGRIFIDKPCYICKDCHEFYCDEDLSNKKYETYDRLREKILKRKYNKPELWINLDEFSENIKIDKDFILNNEKFFMAGIYNIKIDNQFYFLRKSVDLYCKEDTGLFWLNNKNHKVKHNTCYWCGIGDKHLRNYHDFYDKKIGHFNVFYPIETCTYCGCFCSDEKFFEVKEKTINDILNKDKEKEL